jgi:hypothetical protein
MQSVSLKKITLVGFSAPIIIILGAFISVALGRGQAIMLPSTVTTLTFYGVLIAIGAAWRDGAPALFRWMPNFNSPHTSSRTSSTQAFLFVGILSAVVLTLAAIAWLAPVQGVSGLLWRPVLTAVICVWLGIGAASVVPPRVSA